MRLAAHAIGEESPAAFPHRVKASNGTTFTSSPPPGPEFSLGALQGLANRRREAATRQVCTFYSITEIDIYVSAA